MQISRAPIALNCALSKDPPGAPGTRLIAILVHALHARGKRCVPKTMCKGGGLAFVSIVERL